MSYVVHCITREDVDVRFFMPKLYAHSDNVDFDNMANVNVDESHSIGFIFQLHSLSCSGSAWNTFWHYRRLLTMKYGSQVR